MLQRRLAAPLLYIFFDHFFHSLAFLRQSTSLSNRLRRGKLKLTFEQLQLRRVNFKWLTIFGQAGVYFFYFRALYELSIWSRRPADDTKCELLLVNCRFWSFSAAFRNAGNSFHRSRSI